MSKREAIVELASVVAQQEAELNARAGETLQLRRDLATAQAANVEQGKCLEELVALFKCEPRTDALLEAAKKEIAKPHTANLEFARAVAMDVWEHGTTETLSDRELFVKLLEAALLRVD